MSTRIKQVCSFLAVVGLTVLIGAGCARRVVPTGADHTPRQIDATRQPQDTINP